MTPLRLTLREFGPYTDDQKIDFASLDDQRLFLIHGPTGSGKTALLDAICFALYGETSGDDRGGHDLRSDYADDDAPTEVVLDFQLGARTFRVVRRPRQDLAKQRGDGLTTHSEEATLWERTALARGDGVVSETDEGNVLAEGKRDVDGKVESLLGFACDQFRQVVMLPQGKFRKFLSSSSKEREALLKVLFETKKYEALQDVLKAMKADAKDAVQRVRDRQEAELERHGVDTVEALTAKRDRSERIHAKATSWQQTLESRLDAAEDALKAAESAQATLDELADAMSALETLETKKDEHEARKSQLQAARRAAEVAPIRKNLEERRAERDTAQTALQEAEAARDAAKETLDAASESLAAERDRDDEREALSDRLKELDALEEKVQTLSDVDSELETAREKKQSAETRLAEATEKRDSQEDALESAREALDAATSEAAQMELLASQAEEAARLVEQAKALVEKRDALAEATASVESAEAMLNAKETALRETKSELQSLEAKRIEGYASVLADDLVDGEACPVCGSHEHHAPATGAHDVPAPDALDTARQAVEEAQSAVGDAREALREARETKASLEATVDGIVERDPELDTTEVDALKQRRDDAQSALDDARTAAERADALRETVARHEETISALEEDIASAESDVQTAAQAVTRLASRRETVAENVPEDLSTPDALASDRERTASALETLNEALEEAKQAYEDAKTEHTQTEAKVESTQERLAATVETVSTAEARFRDALSDAGFESADAFDAAHLSKDERDALSDAIEQFQSDLSDAEGRVKRARAAAADVDAPDVDAARKRVERLERWVDVQRRRAIDVEKAVESLQDGLDALDALQDDLQTADARFRDVGALADAANGDNDHNLSLQRFVLATRLEEVLRVANDHVARMSRDRYRLHRHDEVQDGRRAAGLDLMVHDAYTGDARPVSTLSGGEGFQAALALALGLSEVVQRVAGGRHIETIFIDEGFGSLDPEALDRAMESLSTLQAGGRLVGIISHVADLKQRVQARLEVQPSQEGSRVRLTT